MTITFFFIVPICAIFHWIAFIKPAFSNENEIRGWIFCYPLMCAFTIVFYILFISDMLESLKYSFFVLEKEKAPYREIDDLINIFDEIDENKNDEKNEDDEKPNCCEKFKKKLFGGDPSKDWVGKEVIYENVS
jgi:hypothetical protein